MQHATNNRLGTDQTVSLQSVINHSRSVTVEFCALCACACSSYLLAVRVPCHDPCHSLSPPLGDIVCDSFPFFQFQQRFHKSSHGFMFESVATFNESKPHQQYIT